MSAASISVAHSNGKLESRDIATVSKGGGWVSVYDEQLIDGAADPSCLFE